MDTPISKRPARRRQLILISATALILIAAVWLLRHQSARSSLRIHGSEIMTGEAKTREFQELISANGSILPVHSVLIDAIIGGKVAERFVLNGADVKTGAPIVRLENTDLELDILNKETMIFDLINNIQHTRNQHEQSRVSRMNELADVSFDLREASRQWKANEELFRSGAISESEYQSSSNRYHWLTEKKKLITEAVRRDSIAALSQLQQMETSLEQARRNLELMKRKLDELIIRSPSDGQLSAFEMEEGQLITPGFKVGQVDVLTAYKVRAQVDEHYNARVNEGQPASLVLDGKDYPMIVHRVYPTVENSLFRADLLFTGETPLQLLRGQNVRVRIEMGRPEHVLVVPRGAFFQSTGGQWVYVLNSEGTSASKRMVRLGRQNPQYYEVLEGLEEGERIITSGYEAFENYEILQLL